MAAPFRFQNCLRLMTPIAFFTRTLLIAFRPVHVLVLALIVFAARLRPAFALALLVRLWVVRHKDTSGAARPYNDNPLWRRAFLKNGFTVSNLPYDFGTCAGARALLPLKRGG